ncbi:MAG: enoyl-CoA hydratase/isomerase family protein [Actinomycetota bacterium]
MLLNDVELVRTAQDRIAELRLPGGDLGATAAAELAAAATELIEDRSIRVVVVVARGDDFCTGQAGDLDVFALRPDPASALASLRPPVIAVLGGACRGVGLEIALAADLRIGAPDTVVALDHVRRGRVPAWGGSQRLPRAVRPGPAVGLALLGRDVDADEALRLGLLHDVADDPTALADELAATLITRGPLALEFTKEAVHRGSELPLRDGLRLEGDLNHQLAATEDRAEGLLAFFEKRPPDFGGR